MLTVGIILLIWCGALCHSPRQVIATAGPGLGHLAVAFGWVCGFAGSWVLFSRMLAQP